MTPKEWASPPSGGSTTSKKLWLGFGTLTAVLMLSSVATIVRVWSIEGYVGEMANARNLSAAVRQLEINTLGYALDVRTYFHTGEPKARQDAVEEAANVERRLREYERLATADRQYEMAARFAPLWQELKKLGHALLDADNRQPKLEDLNRFYDLRTGLEKLLDDEMQVEAIDTYNGRKEAALQDVHFIVGFALILLIVGAVIAVLTSGVIGRGVVKAERQVEKARQFAVSVLETVREPLIVLDGNLRVLRVNRSFYQTFKVTPEETENRLLFELGNGQWNSRELRTLLEDIVPKSSVFDDFELEYTFPAIGRRVMLLSARKLQAGHHGELVLAMEDVTERRRVEEEVARANAADAANRAKSAFLANMSHEMRTPMNAILGFSQLMLRDQNLDARQSQYLGTINRSGEYLFALINDILELAKIEAGRTTLNPSTFDLPDLLHDLEMMFRVRTDGKQLSFFVDLIGDVPRYIVTDINKLRQVLINVLGNAVKFTERGGIVLRVRANRQGATGPFLRVEVEDTGPGISADEQGKLFRHFEQTKTGQQTGTGTGLGLAISRELVRLMGGDITVSSQVGKGSVFVIDVPLKEGEAQAVPTKDKTRQVLKLRPGQAQCRVLIVDDIEDNRQLLAQLLAPIGFEMRLATNGEEAVKEFEEWRPHLILMDFRMPVMDGIEAIRRIRAGTGGKQPKIIAVSASAMYETRQELLEIGADDFISKPFREAELFQKIHAHVGVEYVYAEDPTAAAEEEAAELTPETLAGWPQDLIGPMREAVITADLDQLLAKIQEVETRDPRIAQGLRRLAEQFEYQKLLDLFGPGVPSASSVSPDFPDGSTVLA